MGFQKLATNADQQLYAARSHSLIKPPNHRSALDPLIAGQSWASASPSERLVKHALALAVWNIHYNYHRPHTALGGQPPAAALEQAVTNVVASYI
ncbi:integrase core domain-containing protein [Saccharopolyspora shandongensis]